MVVVVNSPRSATDVPWAAGRHQGAGSFRGNEKLPVWRRLRAGKSQVVHRRLMKRTDAKLQIGSADWELGEKTVPTVRDAAPATFSTYANRSQDPPDTVTSESVLLKHGGYQRLSSQRSGHH